MPTQSLHHGLQSFSNRWLQPSLISIDNPNNEENSVNFHGINPLNFVDMCTETLGCETGAMCYANELEIAKKQKKTKKKKKKEKIKYEFPPPLTTLHGEGRLRLRRKREGGRLVLTPFKPSVLECERSNGRLVLRLLPGREMVEKDGGGVEGMGCFVNGGGGMNRMLGRCKEGDIFNCDSLWVASS